LFGVAEGANYSGPAPGFAYLLMVHIPLVVSAAVIPLGVFRFLYLPVHMSVELIIHPQPYWCSAYGCIG